MSLLPAAGPHAPAGPAFRLAADPGVRIRVVEAGLACCGLEVASAVVRGILAPEDGATASAPAASVLLLSGTMTDALAPAIEAAWEALPEPRAAVAFGACATAGGPYWDAPAIRPGGVLPVAAVVAGCPPRPEALVDAIRMAASAAGEPA